MWLPPLIATFMRIGADTTTGRTRDLFQPGMRSLTYEQHVVFFAPSTAAGGAPVVLRILHQRRNLKALIYQGPDLLRRLDGWTLAGADWFTMGDLTHRELPIGERSFACCVRTHLL